MTATLSLTNDITEFQRLARALNDFGSGYFLTKSVVLDTTLALEEVFSNIINYAFDDDRVHLITCQMTVENDQLNLRVTDDGKPFNPLTLPPPDIHAPIENRCIGGLGIHLVMNLMDTVEYRRIEDKNILNLKVSLTTANPV